MAGAKAAFSRAHAISAVVNGADNPSTLQLQVLTLRTLLALPILLTLVILLTPLILLTDLTKPTSPTNLLTNIGPCGGNADDRGAAAVTRVLQV